MCVSGSKNASLPIMAASLLVTGRVRLTNVPAIADSRVMADILRALGSRVGDPGDGVLEIELDGSPNPEVPADLAARMRASIVLLGPLLARSGRARLRRPGGDEIGMRRVEQHIAGLRAMGAEIVETPDEFIGSAPNGLHGARIVFDLPTVTGTENMVMAAVLASGRTEILNAAREPHVVDLTRFLVRCGADIEGAGTDVITIQGVPELRGAEHGVVADYLEAGTFAIAVAATGGDVTLECSPPEDLIAVLLKLQQAGVDVETGPGTIRIRRPVRRPLLPVDLTTWVHPGFPTDLQAQYMALMTQAHGLSVISEYIFENRFQHVSELVRMGARIEVQGRTAMVRGPARLQGSDTVISDIRSGAALVVAALCARGTSGLANVWHLDRGYEDLEGKLRGLGARIETLESSRGSRGAALGDAVTYE